MLQLAAGLIEHFTERHRDKFQARRQAREFPRGQCGKKMVLTGAGDRRHGSAPDLSPILWA